MPRREAAQIGRTAAGEVCPRDPEMIQQLREAGLDQAVILGGRQANRLHYHRASFKTQPGFAGMLRRMKLSDFAACGAGTITPSQPSPIEGEGYRRRSPRPWVRVIFIQTRG